MSTIAIIRQRGQLTIPDSIRGKMEWVTPGAVVSLATVKANEIVIRPHATGDKYVNWNNIWRNIELARSHKAKYKGSLSHFILEDRESH